MSPAVQLKAEDPTVSPRPLPAPRRLPFSHQRSKKHWRQETPLSLQCHCDPGQTGHQLPPTKLTHHGVQNLVLGQHHWVDLEQAVVLLQQHQGSHEVQALPQLPDEWCHPHPTFYRAPQTSLQVQGLEKAEPASPQAPGHLTQAEAELQVPAQLLLHLRPDHHVEVKNLKLLHLLRQPSVFELQAR